jgi:hypothetical protein
VKPLSVQLTLMIAPLSCLFARRSQLSCRNHARQLLVGGGLPSCIQGPHDCISKGCAAMIRCSKLGRGCPASRASRAGWVVMSTHPLSGAAACQLRLRSLQVANNKASVLIGRGELSAWCGAGRVHPALGRSVAAPPATASNQCCPRTIAIAASALHLSACLHVVHRDRAEPASCCRCRLLARVPLDTGAALWRRLRQHLFGVRQASHAGTAAQQSAPQRRQHWRWRHVAYQCKQSKTRSAVRHAQTTHKQAKN